MLGIGVAYGGLRVLVATAPAGLPRLDETRWTWTVLAFALAVSIVAGVLFGLIPVLKYAGCGTSRALSGRRAEPSQSRERHRARSTLVVAQVALALVLLIGSGLMIRTFQSMRKVDPGFVRPEISRCGASIENAARKEAEQVIRMQDAIRQKLAAVPGVTSCHSRRSVPMDGGGTARTRCLRKTSRTARREAAACGRSS